MAYDQWVKHGRSAPVEMALATIDLAAPPCPQPLEFGPAREGSVGAPALGWSGLPSASGPGFALEVTGGPPGVLALALSAEHARRNALPGGGFTFLVQPVKVGAVALDASGAGSIPVPVSSALVGARRYFQVLLRDRKASHHLGATNGLYVEFCE